VYISEKSTLNFRNVLLDETEKLYLFFSDIDNRLYFLMVTEELFVLDVYFQSDFKGRKVAPNIN